MGPRFCTPMLQVPRETVTSPQIGSTSTTEVALVKDVQVASTSHLRSLRPSEYGFQSAICLWLQTIGLVAVQGEDETEPCGIRDPLFPLVYSTVQKRTEPLSQCGLHQDQQGSLSIHCTVECLCEEVFFRGSKDSRNSSEGGSAVFLEHLADLLEVLLALQDTGLKLMDIHPSQHGERGVPLCRLHDVPQSQSLKVLPAYEMLEVGLKLCHPSGDLIAQSLHLDALLEVVLEGFVLDELEQTLTGQFPVFALSDQSRDLPHVHVLEDVLTPCDQSIQFHQKSLPEFREVSFRPASEKQEGTAVATHELIEGVQFYEF